MVNLRPVVLFVSAVVLLLPAACSTELGPQQRPSLKAGPELPDLKIKLHALEVDQCMSVAVGTVFRECDRFVTEVVNLTVAVTSTTARTAQAAAIAVSASKLTTAGDDYQHLQCGAVSAAQDPDTCGRDLTSVREALTALGSTMDQVTTN